jgi:hypothetical protein
LFCRLIGDDPGPGRRRRHRNRDVTCRRRIANQPPSAGSAIISYPVVNYDRFITSHTQTSLATAIRLGPGVRIMQIVRRCSMATAAFLRISLARRNRPSRASHRDALAYR